ncbi:hypothetical protein D9758_014981 [Tetrapyrgos nigripes]|uniref:LysM domain-containing protein n=1 Tax=Tetrapyrgos nigripes TaxID=182062 RepID=A0A8H5FKZ3_9AGAR|nr:hypothetical protein D9758_014981 [Tetrapyrgos nigripes]
MGRWTQYDEDSYRLPEGMERIGYDADTGRYQFRDRASSVWQGQPGSQFGEMTRVSGPPHQGSSSAAGAGVETEDDDDLEATAAPTRMRRDGYQSLPMDTTPMARRQHVNPAAYRQLLPFFLIIGVILLLVYKFIVAPNLGPPSDPCANKENSVSHLVEPGETCWAISQAIGCSLEELEEMNERVDCGRLMPGMVLCVPLKDGSLKGSDSEEAS